MAQPKMPDVAGARESRAFFAALLAACRSECTCEVCKILRGVADTMTAEFTGGGKQRPRKSTR